MRRSCYILFVLFIANALLPAYPGSATYDPDPRPTAADGIYDAVDYSLYIPIEEPFESLEDASVIITLTNTAASESPVLLDFDGMTCDLVGMTHPILDYYFDCEFEQVGETLRIVMPLEHPANDTFYLTIDYHGTPNGGYYAGNNRYGNTVIYSLSWPSNARCWFPCIDHPMDKATATISVRAPINLRVASNGTRFSADTLEDNVFHVWRSDNPICSYNICFAAAEYIFWTDFAGDSTPIWNYAYPEDSSSALFDWGRTAEILDSFEIYFGNYPLEKYGTATTPFGLGGMEHQSMTFLGDGLVTGGRHYEAVVAHELSHSWFGNSVGLADWRDFWMNEGFAVFSEFLFTEIFFGDESAASYRQSDHNSYMSSGEDFPMFDPDVYLSRTCYNRAGIVIEMLRMLMGDSTFFAAVRDYTERFKYHTVTNDSLRIVMEEHYGESLEWFFDQWVFVAGYPRFEYYYRCNNEDSLYQTHLHITQNNFASSVETYVMPLEIMLETADCDIYDTVWLDTISHDFYWDTEDSVLRVKLDPNYHSLRQAVVVSGIEESQKMPKTLSLIVSPNPFNSICQITIDAGTMRASSASLEIFNIRGQLVAEFAIDHELENSIIYWDASALPSGAYMIKAQDGFSEIEKTIMLIK